MSRTSKYSLLLIVLLSSVVFIRLGGSSLRDYDEGIYAQVSQQILQNNDWLTLTLGENLWFEKPPLFMWATAILFKFFGVSEFWARATSAFSSVLVIILTYLIGSEVFDKRVGLLTVFPLLTGYEFMRQARNGTTDLLLTLIIMAILAVYILYPRKNAAFWYLIAILLSIGFMVKFWAILIVVMAIAINLVFEKKIRETLSYRHFWGAVGIALLLILPWHLSMYFLHGQLFVDRYILYDLLQRTAGPLEGNAGTLRYYFDRMGYDFAPWFILLPVAITVELKRLIRNWNGSGLLLLLTACLFGVYSLIVGTKLFHYLTPIYPLLAIFCASVIVKAYDNYHSTAFSGLVIAALLATITSSTKAIVGFLIIAVLMIMTLYGVYRLEPQLGKLVHIVGWGKWQLFKWISVLGKKLLSYVETLFKTKGYHKLAVLLLCLFLITLGSLRTRHLYDVIESPVEKIATMVREAKPVYDEPVLGVALPPDYAEGIAGPAAMFYSGRVVHVAWSEGELFELTANGPREIIVSEKDVISLSDRFEFTVLAESTPYIYGIIKQRIQP